MGTRRLAREYALQMLYQIEFSGQPLPEVQEHFWAVQGVDSQTRAFADRLAQGVVGEREWIDALIVKHSAHWRLPRMAAVDKNVLRLAIFELKNCGDIPVKVTLNEAIEIGKKFGSEESSAFINGILDKIAKELRPVQEGETWE